MKATGIVRRIDDLGRIVVPKEIRRTLRIREGDPLEIYTNREGEIVLKKYSPVGELGEFAACYAQALSQTASTLVCITDRDDVIAAAGSGKKDLEGAPLSPQAQALIEKRGTFAVTDESGMFPITEKSMKQEYKGAVVSSIICNGDCQGSVMILEKTEDSDSLERLKLLAMSASAFLGKNMEQ